MIIVSITGAIRHGKSKLSRFLQDQEPLSASFESSGIIIELIQAWQQTANRLPSANDIDAINAWVAHLAPLIGQRLALPCTSHQLTISSEELTKDPAHYTKLFAFLNDEKHDFWNNKRAITEDNKDELRPLLQ